MSRGVLLFAFNNAETDYYSMAVATAKRINNLLQLPVSIVTNTDSVSDRTYQFDKTVFVEPETNNFRKKSSWINKGRYQAYDVSPYDQTLLLDTDYMVNSTKLLDLFKMPTDFMCHDRTYWIASNQQPERLNINSTLGIQTLWATVIYFKRTQRTQQIFDMMKQVQNNYEHYSNIYGFLPYTYRNDYALTIAHKTVNGHMQPAQDFIPWPLAHVSNDIQVERTGNTQYVLKFVHAATQRPSYIQVRDLDFHMLGKKNFLELVK